MAQKVGATAQRLRLDTMLRELGARIVEKPASGSRTKTEAAKSDQPAPNDAATAPRKAATTPHDDAAPHDDRPVAITVGEVVDKAARSGFGFLIAVLALVAIPFFGLSTPFGLAIALVGFQLFMGRERPWLPKRARKRRLKMTMLDRILGMVNRRMRWLAASTRRRWQPMVMPRLVGFGVVLLGLGLALPLPIPGSNIIFIVPVLVYAIGLLEGDGMWIVIAHLATLVDMALLIVFGATVLAVLSRAWGYVF